MHHDIIDRREAVDLFRRVMAPSDQFGMIRLLGEAKMGKTHLMSKVFPRLAHEEFGAKCVLLDLRNAQQTVADYLHVAHDLLGGAGMFPEYEAAYEQWMNRPRVAVQGLSAILANLSISGRDGAEDMRGQIRLLSSKFVLGLERMGPEPVVLLFDAVNDASTETQNWLIDTFLVQVSRLPHVRVVISGRMLPDPAGTYAVCCENFELLPVKEEGAFVDFCRVRSFGLEEQSVRDIAKVLGYAPGLFIDYVEPIYGVGSVGHG